MMMQQINWKWKHDEKFDMPINAYNFEQSLICDQKKFDMWPKKMNM